MKLKFYSSILFTAILLLINDKGFSQGTGNHLTMSLENCSNPAANVIQFDLMIESDGASGSDLRLASVSYGINFDTCILQTGATVALSYVSGTTDANLFPTGFAFNFPTSSFINHVRMTSNAITGSNTGNTMVLGHKYRVGTFQITSSSNFTTCCPDFTLQDVPAGGHTYAIALVWIGTAATQTGFSATGTGDGQRSVNVTCTCTNGINENSFNPAITIFPNPASDKLTLILPDNVSEAEIKIFNLIGEENYFSKIKERQTHIDISALTNGVYIIEMKVGDNIGRAKFVKM